MEKSVNYKQQRKQDPNFCNFEFPTKVNEEHKFQNTIQKVSIFIHMFFYYVHHHQDL